MALALVADEDAPASPRALRALHTPTVSVVICSYTLDRWSDLRRAVTSVLRQRHAAQQVVVVIDHCPELLARAKNELTGVTVLASTGKRGLSGARNTGVAAATGEVIAFLDDDATAGRDWLERLVVPYLGPAVVGVGGGVAARWDEGRPSWFPSEFDWVVGCSYRGLPPEGGPVRNPIGANMSLRREAFEQVGGFSDGLGRLGTVPLGCEETELCLRVAEAFPGHEIRYEPDAMVWHRVPVNRTTWRYFLHRCFAEGRSKAAVANLAGEAPALAAERAYVRSVLPRGMLRAVVDGIASPGRLGGAVAIALGALVTAYGYLTGPLAEPLTDHGSAVGTGAPIAPTVADEPGEIDDPAREVGTFRRVNRLSVALLAVTVFLWLTSIPRVDLGAMNDYGLLSVLPATYWLSLVLLCLSFVRHLLRGGSRRLALAHVVVLVLLLHGTPILIDGTLRYSWAWKHVGVVDYILRHHDPYIGNGFSVYAGWPGFFTLNATLTRGAGFASALSYAGWGPLFYGLLDLIPILVILRTFTRDRRHLWTAVWIYVLANWVGQDYFSPQATAYFLYLCVIACVLRWLEDPRRPAPRPGVAQVRTLPRLAVPRRTLAYVVIGLLVVAIATSHQLTPYVLIAGLLGLAITRTRRTTWLALATLLFSAIWAAVAARTFFQQNPTMAFGSFGSVFSNLFAGAQGLAPHPSSALVLLTRLGRIAFLATWALAAVGFWRQRDRWRARLPLAVLAVTPLPMLLTNNYGGEMLLRVYLFSLLPLSFFAAAAFFPRRDAGRSRHAGPALLVTVTLLLVAFTGVTYGKERSNYFTPQEVAASKWLLSQPSGIVYGVMENLPWAFKNYEKYGYHWFDNDPHGEQQKLLADPAKTIAADVTTQNNNNSFGSNAYIILNRSQAADVEMLGTMPADTVEQIGRSLAASSEFSVAYRNKDVVIYLYTGQGGS